MVAATMELGGVTTGASLPLVEAVDDDIKSPNMVCRTGCLGAAGVGAGVGCRSTGVGAEDGGEEASVVVEENTALNTVWKTGFVGGGGVGACIVGDGGVGREALPKNDWNTGFVAGAGVGAVTGD